MKNILLFLMLTMLTLNAEAQIAFEYAYDSAATTNSGRFSQLFIVDFEVSGQKYVRINQIDDVISIYNLNHTIYKSFPIPNVQPVNYYYQVLYLSENLFNTDPEIEYMLAVSNPDPPSIPEHYETRIYNDAGAQLFFADNEYPSVRAQWHAQQYPIYNTPFGTKMILSNVDTKEGKVYGLPGNLVTSITISNSNDNFQNFNAYPNPSSNELTIEYKLEDTDKEAQLIFYDINGKESKTFRIDNSFTSIKVSSADLTPGTYSYVIKTNTKIYKGQKIIIVR